MTRSNKGRKHAWQMIANFLGPADPHFDSIDIAMFVEIEWIVYFEGEATSSIVCLASTFLLQNN